MKKKKGISFRRLAAAVFLFSAFAAHPEAGEKRDPEKIRIGFFTLAPFMMSDADGSPSGVTADFWTTILGPRMGVEIEVSGPYPIPRLELMLETGEIDVIPYITKIPARETRFTYPKRPISTIAPCIIVRKDSPIDSVTSQEDLFGLTIGFISNAYIPPFVKHEKITLDLITTTDFRLMNHNKLMNRRVDALLDINYVSFLYDMKQRGFLGDIRIFPLGQDHTDIFSIFTPSPKGQDLARRFDKAMENLSPDAFASITDRYLNEKR